MTTKIPWSMLVLLACNIFWAGVVWYQATVILRQKEVLQYITQHAIGFRP